MDAHTKAWFELRADILKTMAHPTRLFLLVELSQHEICVYKLAELVNADISTVSKHLKILKQAGIITEEKRGTYAYFHVNMRCLGNFLSCLEGIVRETLNNEMNLLQILGR